MAEAALLVLHICMYVYLYEPFVAFLFVFMVYSVEILSFLSRGGGSHRLRPATIKIKYEERGEKKGEFNDHQIRLGQKKNWYLIGDGRKGIESL